MFRANPYRLPDQVATTLAQICCHENQLPQGAPTSPIVSNMVCARLDGELIRLARRHLLNYTRFADDLTFSTTLPRFPTEVARLNSSPPLATVGPELALILDNNGFSPNPTKTRLQARRSRQEVTGITVSRFPNVPRRFVRRTRAMIHAWERFGYENAQAEYLSRFNRRHRAPYRNQVSFRNVIRGHLGYLAMVRGRADPLVESLRARYGNLDPAFAIRIPPPWHEVVGQSLWVLESEGESIQGTAFATDFGLVTCEHVLRPDMHAFRTHEHNASFPVEVVARSQERDFAVLRISHPLSPLILRSDYTPRVGDQVNVAGFPNHQHGDTGHFLPLRVASLRNASGQPRALVEGSIAGGMSGGPVVDDQCRVIGVVVSDADT